jgi:putative ABC transport system permease protein
MMTVPVLAVSAVATVAASMVPTDGELVEMNLGQTQAVVRVAASPGDGLEQSAGAPVRGYWEVPRNDRGEPLEESSGELVDPADVIDAPVVGVTTQSATVETPEGYRAVSVVTGDVLQPDFSGRWDLVEGRAPRTDREVSATASLLETLEVSLGDTVRAVAPQRGTLTIVGVHESALEPHSATSLVMRDGALGLAAAAEAPQSSEFYVLGDEPILWDEVLELNERGLVVGSRAVILGDAPTPGAIPEQPFSQFGVAMSIIALAAMIGGFLMLQVVLLSAAAFMVGARQQQRSMAIMASVGAEARTLRASVSGAGASLGAVAAIAGVGLGIPVGWLAVQLLDDGNARTWPGFHVEPLSLAVVALVAVLAGWVAAIIPARIASRIDIVTALRGARRPAPPKRGRGIAAVVVLLAGVALGLAGGVILVSVRAAGAYHVAWDISAVILIIVGAITAQLGILLALPAILRLLAHLARGARTPVRLAVRDIARNSGRTVPVAAALMTTVFLSSFLMAIIGASQAETEEYYSPQSPHHSVLVSTRTFDPVTQNLAQIDDREALAQELSEALGGAEVTTIYGVQEIVEATWDPITGEPTVLDDGLIPTVALLQDECTSVWFGPGAAEDEDEDEVEQAACDDRVVPYLFSTTQYLGDRIRVGSVDELELATGMTLSAESRAVLERGGAVALFDEYVADGEVRTEWKDPVETLMPSSPTGEVPAERSDTLPAVVQEPPAPLYAGILLLPDTARELGLDVEPLAVMAQLDEAPSFAQSDAVRAISIERTGEEWGIPIHIETGPTDAVGPSAWALLGVSGVIAITASTVAVGLSRIDGRRDAAILGAVGATPRLRRAIGFWQVLVLAGLGSLVGSALGVAAAGALALPGGPLPFAPPWLQLGLSTVAMPLAIALGAWLFPGRQNALPTDRSAIA